MLRILPLIVLLLLPATEDGWNTLLRGEEEIKVYRDKWGIPHIFADSMESACWAQGWCEAADRFRQMDQFRRAGKGELAEIAGKGAIKQDRDARKRGYTNAELKKMVAVMSDRSRKMLAAYAEGVNAFLEKNEVEARPWDPTDTVAIGVLMARRFGEAGAIEQLVQQMHQTLERQAGKKTADEVLNDILRAHDPNAPTTLHDHAREGEKKESLRPGPRIDPAWYRGYRRELDEIHAVRDAAGLPTYFGSNAWVVSPGRSKSGNAMLYGGPMMGFRTPSICNEIQLQAPGLNSAGMSFPGAPGVMIGFNRKIAWTTTSGGADLVDVYVLELNPENPEQYRYKGEWKDFEKVEHTIAVRDADPETLTVYRSVYGPLSGDRDLKNNSAYTLAMSFWMQEQKTFEAVMDMNFAADVKEFAVAAEKITTSHNFFAADTGGDIGFWFCGKHPKRHQDHDARFPQKGDGSLDWRGFIPFKDVPQSVNPAHGFFANWNNKPARDWEPMPFGKVFWGKKIIDVLEAEEKIDLERVWTLSRETAYHSFLADYFLPHLIPCLEDGETKDYLRTWDHMNVKGEIGPTLVSDWVRTMFSRVMGDELGIMVTNRQGQRFIVDILLYLFEGEDCRVELKHDWIDKKDLQAEARKAMASVLKKGTDRLKYLAPRINFRGTIGAVPSEKGRGTFQMAVELTKNGPVAYTLAAPGQSEDPESDHYDDQIELFRKWRYKKFVFEKTHMK